MPARSIARTCSCAPRAVEPAGSAAKVAGEAHGWKPGSCRWHSKRDAGSLEENSKRTVAPAGTVPAGPEEIVVSGAVESSTYVSELVEHSDVVPTEFVTVA